MESGKYDEIFEDYASGGSTNHPKLQEMLKWIRRGDVVEVHSIDRLARNINDLLQIVKTITEDRHAEIYFIKENLRFTDDTDNPFNKLTLQIIGSIAEFERNMIKMRQKEGLLLPKQKVFILRNGVKNVVEINLNNDKHQSAQVNALGGGCRYYKPHASSPLIRASLISVASTISVYALRHSNPLHSYNSYHCP